MIMIENRLSSYTFIASANAVAQHLMQYGAQDMRLEPKIYNGKKYYDVVFLYPSGKKYWVT